MMQMQVTTRDASIADLQRRKVKRMKRGECPECGTKLYKTSNGVLGRMKKATPIEEEGKCFNGKCLVCFPGAADDAEEQQEEGDLPMILVKKGPIPRMILTYQANGMDGVMDSVLNGEGSNNNCGNGGGRGLDFDDDMSAITLDRKIRSVKEQQPTAPLNDSSKVSLSLLSEQSESSVRARMRGFLSENPKEGYDDHDWNIDVEGDSTLLGKTASNTHYPEQAPTSSSRKTHSSNPAVESTSSCAGREIAPKAVENSANNNGEKRRMSLAGHKSKSEMSILKKVFLPPSVFVPPSSVTTPDSIPASQHSSRIIDANPAANGRTTSRRDINAPPERKVMYNKRNAMTEIVFDPTAIFSPVVKAKVDETNVRRDNPSKTPTDSCGDETCSSGLDSDIGCADDKSSVDGDAEMDDYGEYSSKLLMMLDHSESNGDMIYAKHPATSPSARPLVENNNNNKSDSCSSHEYMTDREKMVDTVPTTTNSSQVASDEGSNILQGSADMLHESFASKEDFESKAMRKKSQFYSKETPLLSPRSPKQALVSSFSRLKMNEPGLPEILSSSPDLSKLLSELQSGRRTDHESTLLQITDFLWSRGPPAKHQFVASSGIKILSATMWADMMVPGAERAAAELFLSLVTSSTRTTAVSPASKAATDSVLGHQDTEGLIDALLVTMQTLILDDELQQVGCRVLCCLASSSNVYDIDGTRSGACLAVLNAMDAHYNSEFVQEWGLRALYNQCVHSKNAEENKQTVLTSKLDTNNVTGEDVLERILVSGIYHLKDGGVLEWTCRVCWCLATFNGPNEKMISLKMDALLELLHILEQCRSIDDASPQLQEAVLGMIANLSKMPQYKSFLGTPDIVFLLLDTMHGNKEFVEVQIEACGAIGNISGLLTSEEKEEIIDAGAVRTIVGAMFAYPREKHTLQEPALRALVGLSRDSDVAKEEICDHETLSVLMHLCILDDSCSPLQQEALCDLISSLYASDRLLPVALHCDSFGILTAAAGAFPDAEKIQESFCFSCRSVSKKMENLDIMVRCDAIGFTVAAMKAFRYSKSIQGNACCTLWNIGIGSEFGHQTIAETNAVDCIVNAIKTNLEAEEVVDVACGALWGLIHRSHVLRQQFLSNDSGVDSVACTLVMHPRSTSLLEKACGVLALTCSNMRGASSGIGADAISGIVETMRNHPKSVTILQHGAHLLRNNINRNHSIIVEAIGAITVVMHALRDFNRNDPFQSESCSFIWAIAKFSQEAKSKIIATQGIPILRKILDQKGVSSFVRDAALGAYRELTHESESTY